MSEVTLPIVTVVGAILENEYGEVLLAQRPANKSTPFLWEFPGGKIESLETPEDAMIRELFEEIGIQVQAEDLKPFTFVSLRYPDFYIILLCYHCRKWVGEPIAREGQGGIDWVKPEDLKKYPMREANQRLIPILEERSARNETLKGNPLTTKSA
jgi:8-oxo-dGTP diphosphatase